jgi:hypothetical protein
MGIRTKLIEGNWGYLEEARRSVAVWFSTDSMVTDAVVTLNRKDSFQHY